MTTPRFLDQKAAARRLADLGVPVKPETLARWRCTGRYHLPFIKIGKLIRYDTQDLDRFAERHRVTPGGEAA